MEFVIDNFPETKFTLTLIQNVQNTKYFSELEKRDDIVLLNPDYIVSSYQVMLSINRAMYNFNVLKRHKCEKLKKEIIYYSSEKGKIDMCMKVHKINITDSNPNVYILFIDLSKEGIEGITSQLKGVEILPENYSKFVNFEKICKEFEIKEEEKENDAGIMGAVYSRIAIKDYNK